MRYIILLFLCLGSLAHGSSENEKTVFSKILNVGECEYKGKPNWTYAELKYQMEFTRLSQNGLAEIYSGAQRRELGEREGYTVAKTTLRTQVYVARDSTDVPTAMAECAEFREKLIQFKERVK